jgi:hypothetical protein
VRLRALTVLLVVPLLAGCGASKSCESALKHAERVATPEYRRQLRVPGQTRPAALTTAVAVGRSTTTSTSRVAAGTARLTPDAKRRAA